MAYIPKQHDPCILFLEDFFTESDAEQLRKHYPGVERFARAFPDARRKVQQAVKDSPIIRYCDAHRYLLVTTDREMQFTHVEELKKSTVAVLATANNNHSSHVWVKALIDGKAAFERYYRKHERPCFAVFNKRGRVVSHCVITPDRYTRRYRPREMELPESARSSQSKGMS